VPTVAQVFSEAWRLHQAGGFLQAESLYRQILQADPSHADAWCFLGAACQSQGKTAEAESHFRQAVRALPSHTSALNCLGVLLAEQGRYADATASFKQALVVEPRSVEIHNNLGLALSRQGKKEEAVQSYRQALRLKPDYAQAYYNLGLTLNGMRQHDAAIEQFQRAVQLQPDYAEAMNDMGNALGEKGALDEAVNSYQRALSIRPHYAEAHYNLGVVFGRLQRHHAALFHYQQALHFKPDYAEAHMNLANVLQGMWKFDEAVESYQRAVHFRPNYSAAFHGLGGVYLRQGRLELAVANFKEALRLEPDSADLHSNLLFCMNYDPEADPDTIFAEHCRFGELHDIHDARKLSEHTNDPTPERRLRVGYVSPDLRFHALTRYLEPVLIHHDPQKVETFCYAEVAVPDNVTARLQGLVPAWRSTCGQTDAEVAQRIRDDKIDILVDLAGHTANNRLCAFALKPAPVQATWLGYMNTTGLKAVDYRLTDEVLDPASEVRCPESGVRSLFPDAGHRTPDTGQIYDTEELVRLPGGMCCFASPTDAPEVSPLPALKRGHLTFGSLHNLFKLNPKVFDLWSQLLQETPSTKLIMFRHTLTGSAQDDIRREFAQRGIGAERLELRQGSDTPGYLAVYDEIDVSLDTFPYTGGVTTCESLWMGVPVLSLRGVRPAGRNSAAILTRVGLGDWAVNTAEEYLALAKRTGDDLDGLARLRAGLRATVAATLCDAEQFTRSLEEVYRSLWRRWCEQQKSRH
jgi:protein O-GlcNAc transferase